MTKLEFLQIIKSIEPDKHIIAGRRGSDFLNILKMILPIFVIASFVVSIMALHVTNKSLEISNKSIELASYPRVSIIQSENILGDIAATSSKFSLALKNNFPGDITDTYIDVDYLQMFIDKETRHPTVCPYGYAQNHQNENRQFGDTNNMTVYNIFTKKFNLASLEEHEFSIDFGKDYRTMIEDKARNADEKTVRNLIKIDINYMKSINNEPFQFSKVYLIFNNENIFDLEENPDKICYNDTKNQTVDFPSIVCPFEEPEFVNKVKSLSRPYSFIPSGCLVFKLYKKENIIEY